MPLVLHITTESAELLSAVNIERARAGLPSFVRSPKLDKAATWLAFDNARSLRSDHIGPAAGAKLEKRVTDAGYQFSSIAEAVADALEASHAAGIWLKSPPHKAILLGDYYEAGTAAAEGSDGRWYCVLVVGNPWVVPKPLTWLERLLKLLGRGNG